MFLWRWGDSMENWRKSSFNYHEILSWSHLFFCSIVATTDILLSKQWKTKPLIRLLRWFFSYLRQIFNFRAARISKNHWPWFSSALGPTDLSKQYIPKQKRPKSGFILYTGLYHLYFEPPHDKTNKMTDSLCTQRRLRSAWASAHSDQSPRCPHEESLGP